MKHNWKRTKISDLCDLIVDCVNKTAPKVSYETDFKMLRTTNIKNGRIDTSNCYFVEKNTFKKWTKRASVKKNDILLTREAPMGEVGLVNFDENVFLGQRIVQYRANQDKLDSYFLLYSFLSPDLQFQFKRHSGTGSTVSHIRVPDCTEFEISHPLLGEQKKIAAVLSALDAKIDCNNRINAELEAMAKTLYDYWFVQFDFPISKAQAQAMGIPALEGKPYKSSGGKMEYNKVLKREIPAGWEDSSILAVADLLGGGTPTKKNPEFWGGEIPFFTPTDADGTIFKFTTADYITNDGLKKSSTKLFPKNTIFITARGSVGRLVLTGVSMAMNQSCYALQAKPKIPHTFLFFLTKELVHHLEVKSSGSVFDSIVSNDIEFTKLAIPDLGSVQQFGEIVGPTFKQIANNIQQNHHLAQLRDWLLPMLMNGQVTVA